MCVCARADVPFGDGSGFRVWDLGLSNRTFGRRARNRAAPRRIETCLSPPPLPFESARVSRESGRRVRRWVREVRIMEARVRTSGCARRREADERSGCEGSGR